jgi:hypothetical protein
VLSRRPADAEQVAGMRCAALAAVARHADDHCDVGSPAASPASRSGCDRPGRSAEKR